MQDQAEFIKQTLAENMFADLGQVDRDKRIASVIAEFGNNKGKAHNTHIQYEQCLAAGLNVSRLEDDQKLQDLVLTVHHCYMHTLANTLAFKIVENQLGRAMVRIQQPQFVVTPKPSGQADAQ